MKSIGTLIRIKRWELDQKRRALADLEGLHQELRERAAALEQRLAAEQDAARDDTLRFAYAAYARRAIEQREALKVRSPISISRSPRPGMRWWSSTAR